MNDPCVMFSMGLARSAGRRWPIDIGSAFFRPTMFLIYHSSFVVKDDGLPNRPRKLYAHCPYVWPFIWHGRTNLMLVVRTCVCTSGAAASTLYIWCPYVRPYLWGNYTNMHVVRTYGRLVSVIVVVSTRNAGNACSPSIHPSVLSLHRLSSITNRRFLCHREAVN